MLYFVFLCYNFYDSSGVGTEYINKDGSFNTPTKMYNTITSNKTLYAKWIDSCSSTTTSSYGSWGSCSKTCEGGTQTRTVYKVSAYDGSVCPATTESQACNTQPCCSSGGTYNSSTGKCEYNATLSSYRCPRGGTADSSGNCTYTGKVKAVWCRVYVGENGYCSGTYSGGWCYAYWSTSDNDYYEPYCPSGWDVNIYYTNVTVEGLGYVVNGRSYTCPEGTLQSDHMTCLYAGRPVYSCPNGGSIVNPNCDNGYTCSNGISVTDGGNHTCYNTWESTNTCTCVKNNATYGTGTSCSGGTSSYKCQDNACYGNDGRCYLYSVTPSYCENLGYTLTGCTCATGNPINFLRRCTTTATSVSNCRNNVCSYTP